MGDIMNIMKLLVAFLASSLIFVACDVDKPASQPTPEEPKEEAKSATVSLTLTTKTQDTITFTVLSGDASEVRWLCVAQSMTNNVEAEDIMTLGHAIEANKSVEVVAENLIAGATYEIHAAASNSDGKITVASALVVMTDEAAVAEATYQLCGNLTVSDYVQDTNGLRNDYVSFYDTMSGLTLFIDFYSPMDGKYLPTGRYPLGDGSSMTTAQEYTYLTLYTNGELLRFESGHADVGASYDAVTNTTIHSVSAYYTMASGETVSLQFSGVFSDKSY